MDTAYWEDSPAARHVKFESGSEGSALGCKEDRSIFHFCDGNLNFATVATSEDDEFNFHKKKVSRDPMSHRIIEKRRRDRMNNCLADLSRLIPADYLKKGRGRIEKTEIIEMAIKHMKHLQAHACHQLDTCELAQQQNSEEAIEHPNVSGGPIVVEHYRLGYQECLSEAMHFMVEVEGFFAGDPLCVQLINHLQKHCDKILKGDRLNFPRTHLGETTSTSSGSTGSGSYTHHHVSTMPLGSSGLGSSSSPGSGSCSDSGRPDTKDIAMNGRIACNSQQVPKIPSQRSSNEDIYDERLNLSRPSQLREMLTTSNHTSANNSTTITNLQHSTSVTHQSFHAPVSPGVAHVSGPSPAGLPEVTVHGNSAASLYKFKNNIKQRFTAEHHFEDRREEMATINQEVSENHYASAKRRRYASETNEDTISARNSMLTLSLMPEMGRHRDSETCSVPSSPPSPGSKYLQARSPSPDISHIGPPSPQKPLSIPNYGIPIFALHSRGTFYIPLTLDSDTLAPYLADLGFGNDASNHSLQSTSVPFHSVTISVSYQHDSHMRTQVKQQSVNQCSQSLAWKNESNGFLPLTKWSVCKPERE